MKKLLFIYICLIACVSCENDPESTVWARTEFSFSKLSITQTTENSASVAKKTYEYEDGMLSSHTVEQSFTGGSSLITFDIVHNSGQNEYVYRCLWHEWSKVSYYYYVTYSYNRNGLATSARYVYADGDPRDYTMQYTIINGKYYLESITELISNSVRYVLTFDYSRLNANEIEVTQELLGERRTSATFGITRENKKGIPDVNLNDTDFHPLDQHIEALYSGLLGTFDYFIAKINKEVKTAVSDTKEMITSTIELDADGYLRKITSVSDKKSKATKYFSFTYE